MKFHVGSNVIKAAISKCGDPAGDPNPTKRVGASATNLRFTVKRQVREKVFGREFDVFREGLELELRRRN